MGGFLEMLGIGGGQEGGAVTTPYVAAPPVQGTSMDAVVNGAPAGAPQPSAPASPEELQQRTAGWRDLLEKVKTDPNMQQAMFHVATRLTQPMDAGQTTLGHFGKALSGGQMYLQMMNKNQQDYDLKAKEQASQQEHRAASTAGIAQETQQKAELFPQTKAKLDQDLANARTDQEIKRAKLAIEQFNSSPENMATNLKLDQDRTRAQTGASRAAAGNSSASAKLHRRELDILDSKAAAIDSYQELNPDGFTEGGGLLLTGSKDPKAVMRGNIAAYEEVFASSSEGARRKGETNEQYKARASDFAIRHVTKAGEAAKVTAANAILNNVDSTPEDKAMATEYLKSQLVGSSQVGAGGGGGNAAWLAARNSVGVGEMYTGPDGKQYKRSK